MQEKQLHHVLQHKNRLTAVSGYIRQTCHVFIPNDLLHLFRYFYDDNVARLNLKVNRCNLAYPIVEQFTVNNIRFDLQIASHNDSITLRLCATHIPSYISSITIYYTLYCNDRETRDIQTMTAQHNTISWDTNTHGIPSATILDVGVALDILNITHFNHYYAPITLNKHTSFYWDIDSSMLHQFIHKTAFYSKLINDCWVLKCKPNSDKQEVSVTLKLIKLPPRIGKIRISTQYGVICDKDRKYSEWNGIVQLNKSICIGMVRITSPHYGLRMSLDIDLIECYDTHQMEMDDVKKDQWRLYHTQYGIVDQKHFELQYDNDLHRQYIDHKYQKQFTWNIKTDSEIRHTFLTLHGIQFRVDLYPTVDECIQIQMKLTHLAPNIATIIAYYRFYCKQTQVELKQIKQLCKQNKSIKCKLGKSMSNEVHFEYEVKILKIRYKDKTNAFDYALPIAMNQCFAYECHVEQSMQSDTFNNCFCLSRSNQNLSLILLGLPRRIQSICVQIVFECAELSECFCGVFEFSYETTVYKFASHAQQTHDALRIGVDLRVIGVRSIYGLKVDESDWIRYGIMHAAQSVATELEEANDYELRWNIKGSESLLRFKSCANGVAFGAVPFTINDIEFVIALYPNGRSSSDSGQIRFVLSLCALNVDRITLFVHLWCVQTLSEFQRTICYKRVANKQLSVSWHADTLALSDVSARCDVLQFGCYVQILNIKYNYVPCCNVLPVVCTAYNDYYCDVQMHQYSDYQWEIDNAQNETVLYSEEIDRCWILSLSSNNELCLRCVRLPRFIIKLEVEIGFKTNLIDCHCESDEAIVFQTKFSYNHNVKCILDEQDLVGKNIAAETDKTTVQIMINVVRVYSASGEVDFADWKGCGILTDTN